MTASSLRASPTVAVNVSTERTDLGWRPRLARRWGVGLSCVLTVAALSCSRAEPSSEREAKSEDSKEVVAAAKPTSTVEGELASPMGGASTSQEELGVRDGSEADATRAARIGLESNRQGNATGEPLAGAELGRFAPEGREQSARRRGSAASGKSAGASEPSLGGGRAASDAPSPFPGAMPPTVSAAKPKADTKTVSTTEKKKKARSDVPYEDENRDADLAAQRALAEAEGMLMQLASLESDLRDAGVRLPQDSADTAANGDAAPVEESPDAPPPPRDPESCTQVCELAEAICDLEIRICALARAHPEDDRYRNACERAAGDCKAGSEACNACE